MRALALLIIPFCSKQPARPDAALVKQAPGPEPGHCREVTITPPCELLTVTPVKNGDAVRYIVQYKDAGGRDFPVNVIEAKESDRTAIEAYYQTHAAPSCAGGWTTAPCPDNPRVTGLPAPPPIGKVVQ